MAAPAPQAGRAPWGRGPCRRGLGLDAQQRVGERPRLRMGQVPPAAPHARAKGLLGDPQGAPAAGAQRGATPPLLAPRAVLGAAARTLAALIERSGLAERAAQLLAARARGSAWALYRMVCALCALLTAAVSLDGAVVLMIPLLLRLARRWGAPPAPLFLGVVAVANTASLALPQGNPTNLLPDRPPAHLPGRLRSAHTAPRARRDGALRRPARRRRAPRPQRQAAQRPSAAHAALGPRTPCRARAGARGALGLDRAGIRRGALVGLRRRGPARAHAGASAAPRDRALAHGGAGRGNADRDPGPRAASALRAPRSDSSGCWHSPPRSASRPHSPTTSRSASARRCCSARSPRATPPPSAWRSGRSPRRRARWRR